jgi:hypothetical protein
MLGTTFISKFPRCNPNQEEPFESNIYVLENNSPPMKKKGASNTNLGDWNMANLGCFASLELCDDWKPTQ